MKIPDKKYYPSEKEYDEAIQTLIIYATVILFSFAEHSKEKRDIIIRNLIARGTATLKAIQTLWKLNQYQDAWILHRSLVDRLFHLMSLSDNDAFELFEQWSFIQQYEQRNRARSDPLFKDSLNPAMFRDTPAEKERYRQLKKLNPVWERPRPEAVARKRGVHFIYKYGYDYGSAQVHPLADDGDVDFRRLTGLNKYDEPIDQRVLLTNSCLTLILLIQEALNAGTLKWRAVVYNFLDDLMALLREGSKEYKTTFVKIGKLGEQRIDLCRRRTRR